MQDTGVVLLCEMFAFVMQNTDHNIAYFMQFLQIMNLLIIDLSANKLYLLYDYHGFCDST